MKTVHNTVITKWYAKFYFNIHNLKNYVFYLFCCDPSQLKASHNQAYDTLYSRSHIIHSICVYICRHKSQDPTLPTRELNWGTWVRFSPS